MALKLAQSHCGSQLSPPCLPQALLPDLLGTQIQSSAWLLGNAPPQKNNKKALVAFLLGQGYPTGRLGMGGWQQPQ